MQYVELKDKPINPNRAKWYALLLCAVAALIALMTLKSNYDYFAQYYQGFGFWMRVIPFFSVEVTIIALPLTKGWGSLSQQIAALICEVVLIGLSITHTSFVSQASQAKIQAGKTKAEAQVDFDRAQTQADRIAKQNEDLQNGYNRAMIQWNRAAAIARRNREQSPTAPAAPQLMTVPQIDQKVVNNSMLSTEQASEAEVSHALLLRLLYAMIAGVIASAASIVWLADASRVKAWLLRQKAEKIREATTGARVVDTGQPGGVQSLPLPVEMVEVLAQEPRRVAGFGQPVNGSVKQSVSRSVNQPVNQSAQTALQITDRGLYASPTRGGYSLMSDRGEYLCYLSKVEAGKYAALPASTVLAQVRGRVEARRENGNKQKALAEINRLIRSNP